MRKLKLFLAACALLGAGQMFAQTDVTATYITNADFSSTDGWTANKSEQYNAIGNGLIGTYQVNEGTAATVDESHPADAYCFGFQSRWSTNYSNYTQQTTELPAGYYRLSYDVQNTNTGTTNSYYDDLCYVLVGSDKYIPADIRLAKAEWMKGNSSWTSHYINFQIKSASAVTISLGYGQGSINNLGNAATPYIYVSNLKLESLADAPEVLAIDMSSLITNPDFTNNTSGWTTTTGAQNTGTANNQTGDFLGAFWENWNGSAYTGKLYQVLSGLSAGIYEVGLCAFVNTLGDAGTQYVYAGDQKTNLTTGEPTRYVVSCVAVADGTLEIGLELTSATANWCGIDHATLVKIADPDLSDYVDAYKAALEKAQAVDQSATMAASILTALQNTLSTYANVDETSQSDLEEAIEALSAATTNANTSIASYAIIATGTIPDNSLEGWTCENSNTFHINSWSTEGNSDGSNMVTPFIENWIGSGSYLGAGKVYYKLEGLEPGEVYYAQALVRSYNEANSDAPNGPDFFINDVVTKLTEAGTTFTYDGKSGIYATLGGAATVGNDGTLTLGIEIAADRNYNWVAFKSVSIRPMADALQAAVDAANEAIEAATLSEALATALKAKVEALNKSYTSASEYETAIAALTAIANEEVPAVAKTYADWSTLKANAKALMEETTDAEDALTTFHADFETADASAEKATTEDGINVAMDELTKAICTYVAACGEINLTCLLTNPDVTSLWTGAWNVKPEGWYNEQDGGNFQVMANDEMGPDGEVFMEYWSESPAQNGFVLCQKVTLPEGTYKMTGRVAANFNGQGGTVQNVFFAANETLGTQITSETLMDASIEFVNTEEQLVTIGMKATSGNEARWMGINKITLAKVPASSFDLDEEVAFEPVDKAGTVNLKKTVYSGWNTVVLPFGVDAETVAAQFGEGQLYEFTGYEDGTLNFAEATAIAPHTPYLFNSGATEDAEAKEMTFAGVTISTGTPATEGTEFSFVGTYEPLAKGNDVIVAGDYVLGATSFNKAKGGNALKAFRAYIKNNTLDNEETAPARLAISLNGEATSIETLDGRVLTNAAIYNLAGQKVEKAQKGIYIQNGKKVVVK